MPLRPLGILRPTVGSADADACAPRQAVSSAATPNSSLDSVCARYQWWTQTLAQLRNSHTFVLTKEREFVE
jgi:hypothetical protein